MVYGVIFIDAGVIRHPFSIPLLEICMKRIVLFILGSTVLIGTGRTDEPAKLTQTAAEQIVFQNWKEVRIETKGKSSPGGLGVRFGRDGDESWLLHGELSPSTPELGSKVVINADANPMQIDFVRLIKDQNKEFTWVKPCIFKVENGLLVIVEPGNKLKYAEYRKDGDYAIRPIGFEATKANNYIKKILKTCQYLDQDEQ